MWCDLSICESFCLLTVQNSCLVFCLLLSFWEGKWEILLQASTTVMFRDCKTCPMQMVFSLESCFNSLFWCWRWLEIILELDRNLKLNLQGIGSRDCFSGKHKLFNHRYLLLSDFHFWRIIDGFDGTDWFYAWMMHYFRFFKSYEMTLCE